MSRAGGSFECYCCMLDVCVFFFFFFFKQLCLTSPLPLFGGSGTLPRRCSQTKGHHCSLCGLDRAADIPLLEIIRVLGKAPKRRLPRRHTALSAWAFFRCIPCLCGAVSPVCLWHSWLVTFRGAWRIITDSVVLSFFGGSVAGVLGRITYSPSRGLCFFTFRFFSVPFESVLLCGRSAPYEAFIYPVFKHCTPLEKGWTPAETS